MLVASVPADHAYVRHLAPPTGSAAFMLPPALAGGAPDAPWRPSPVLEPAWLRAHADQVDVVHVHFGFEHRSAAELAAFVGALRALAVPLVLTVHDLHNPHLHDQGPHAAALDVLVPAAAAVVTLTPGAAAEIARRWGRRPLVLAHPHVVPLDRLDRPRPAHDGFVVGLHAKPRPNNDPDAVRPELAAAVAGLPGGRRHPDLVERLPDQALWQHLTGLDVLVLAYRHATHSGFVEACHDLGTAVLAPRVGYLGEQQRVLSYDLDRPGSLTAALRRAHEQGPAPWAGRAPRSHQRTELAAAHTALYARALGAAVAA